SKGLWNRPKQQAHARWLPNYQLVSSHEIPEIEDNLSGLAVAEDRNQLLGILNRPPTIVALSMDGHYLHRYDLDNISDTESIAYMGDGRVAVTSEKTGQVVLFRLPEQPGQIDLKKAPSITLLPRNDENNGLEGLGYDLAGDTLYAVKEHSPRALFRIEKLC